ncbi:MAG TPA: tetratricopeptide repeat protein [Steroidobacteraceae bacterium]|nr:tetratricopeptide repeat protein [Steroidobacteraceae bacterium]
MDEFANLMHSAQVARREGRLQEAHQLYAQALGLCRQVAAETLADSKRNLIAALKGLGQIERDLGRGRVACPLYVEAVELCRLEGDVLLLAHTVRHLGDIHQELGNLAPADKCYREALAIYRTASGVERLDLANALRSFAVLHDSLARDSTALWIEAKNLYEAAGIVEGVEGCARRIVQRGT